jgi:hypothetical protein
MGDTSYAHEFGRILDDVYPPSFLHPAGLGLLARDHTLRIKRANTLSGLSRE